MYRVSGGFLFASVDDPYLYYSIVWCIEHYSPECDDGAAPHIGPREQPPWWW